MEKYIVRSKKTGKEEHEIFVYDNTYEIYYSKNQLEWANPGGFILRITDTGNGFNIKPKLKKNIDYGLFAYAHILMTFIKSYDKHLMDDYEIIETITTSEV